MTTGVTGNVSAQVGRAVICNCDHKDAGHTSRRGAGDLPVHCRTCHRDGHRACAICGACMSTRRRSRLDRVFCSGTCRGRARQNRLRWERDHPEEVAQKAAEREVWLRGLERIAEVAMTPQQRARRQRTAELKATAERCAKCDKPFGAGDVIYRRREGSPLSINAPILPYCAEDRCGQPEGYHNRDLHDGYTYRGCRCEDHHWEKPQPCIGCGRLVSNPQHAPWRYGRDWVYGGERLRAEPRVFCSSTCQRRVRIVEAKVRRLSRAQAQRQKVCVVCGQAFTRVRRDAITCGAACRQKAYRQRREEARR